MPCSIVPYFMYKTCSLECIFESNQNKNVNTKSKLTLQTKKENKGAQVLVNKSYII